MTPVLKASGVSVSFGGVRAVVELNVEVNEGQLVGLIGPNGAGKTTFVDAIAGFVRSRGSVELDGSDLTGLPPHARARQGLARTWQSIDLFDDLTVRENLLVAMERPSVWRTVRETISAKGMTDDADPVLELLGLGSLADELPAVLTQAQRKLVGIGRALAPKPRLVCLDEPAAGLDTNESEELGRTLRRLADDGQAMLLIDHDMGLVLGICDYVYVLEFGTLIAHGPPDVVRRQEHVIEAYLGGAAAEVKEDVEEAASAAEIP
jgi:branched-chain amino acid transport system ATP-binding protein